MAAEQGSIESEWVLSTLYEFGRAGLTIDLAQFFKWALKAAQRGHMIAQPNVATAYFRGWGVDENLERALYWCRRAAEQALPTPTADWRAPWPAW
jgi:TPR repeat protein